MRFSAREEKPWMQLLQRLPFLRVSELGNRGGIIM